MACVAESIPNLVHTLCTFVLTQTAPPMSGRVTAGGGCPSSRTMEATAEGAVPLQKQQRGGPERGPGKLKGPEANGGEVVLTQGPTRNNALPIR